MKENKSKRQSLLNAYSELGITLATVSMYIFSFNSHQNPLEETIPTVNHPSSGSQASKDMRCPKPYSWLHILDWQIPKACSLHQAYCVLSWLSNITRNTQKLEVPVSSLLLSPAGMSDFWGVIAQIPKDWLSSTRKYFFQVQQVVWYANRPYLGTWT